MMFLSELRRRFAAEQVGALVIGASIKKSIVPLRSFAI